jgi:hypothetical protein
MTLHYHGTPISPNAAMLTLAGRCFCVSYARPNQVMLAHQLGQSVLLDNGAFSAFTRGEATDWPGYYQWCDRWLAHPTTWAVIPDVIDGPSQEQDGLLNEWPHGHRGAPVWHLDEPITRLLRLADEWPRVCLGSSGEFWKVLSEPWRRRMDEVFNEVGRRHRRLPWLHMLRGMQACRGYWPFGSVDSTDIGQNHHRPENTPLAMANRWDATQCPASWAERTPQGDLWELTDG